LHDAREELLVCDVHEGLGDDHHGQQKLLLAAGKLRGAKENVTAVVIAAEGEEEGRK